MRQTAEQATRPVGSLATRWDELQRQAAELAALAQLGPESGTAKGADFAAALSNAHEWQRELAWQGVEDIDAMMKPGLTALKVITSRGMDASAPAQALWREFHTAREAVLGLVSPSESAAA